MRLATLCTVVFLSLVGEALYLVEPVFSSECTHYASPTGAGSGSPSQPFKIADFWRIARPGYTLCLNDGEYRGSSSMINPPRGLSGKADLPITVRALNDGKATINGQDQNVPVRLQNNNYFVLEGFNAHNSASSVVTISNADHNIVRRVAGWDAADKNANIFAVNHADHNLLEDVAGWGVARKIFSSSQGGNSTTIRRAWGRWEGSHVVGPKMTYDLAYNNYDLLAENIIGTWNGERMTDSYDLRDYGGRTWQGRGQGHYSEGKVDQPYGIFSVGGFSNGDKNPRTRLLGSIAYVQSQDRFQPDQAIYITTLDAIQLSDIVAYLPGSHADKAAFRLDGVKNGVAANLVANALTGISGAGAKISPQWQTSQIFNGRGRESVPSIFADSKGANLCHRYRDGTLTDEPLWPWPMNDRILKATIDSGRAPVDVTKTIESMFGPIPSKCRHAVSNDP
jgi:hypothetical protein